MNQQQLKRIELRIQAAAAAFIAAKMAALGEQPEVPEYSESEMIAMIRLGTATLKEHPDHHYSVTSNFDYPLTVEMVNATAAEKAWGAARDKIRAEADAISNRLLDEAILSKDGMAVPDRIAAAFTVETKTGLSLAA